MTTGLPRLWLGWICILLAAAPAPGRAEDDLLPADQAYRISAEAVKPDQVRIHWAIADGYYLYKDKIRFRNTDERIELGEPDLPPGEKKHDDFFGEMEIYRHGVSVLLPLKRGPDAPDLLTLTAQSQGCADIGVCYPPHRQELVVKLPPAASTAAVSTPAGDEGASRLAALSRDLGLDTADDEVLEPDQAYRLKARVEGPGRVLLHWDIADGTYLYKDKVRVALEGADLAAPPTLPAGKVKHDALLPDGDTGDVEVYYHGLDLPLEIRTPGQGDAGVTLKVRYQGCADRGICYPPITKTLHLDLKNGRLASAAAPQAAPSGPPPETYPAQSETDRIAARLQGGNVWLILASFFGFGLLLALTPCVFPMIPILSGIIAGQGHDITPGRGFLLALVYVLAMAVTYSLAGVLAGLFGGNLQAWFQSPWILGAFAGLFVLLALSMFGFFELQMPSAVQSRLTEVSGRQRGGTLAGVAVMGLLSALIVGPCVAPPLAGALIYIGHTGDAALGGLALFVLALGMGTPLLALGASAGRLLPKAGPWMDTVKAVFGVVLLAVAVSLLERILPPVLSMFLWALLAIVPAVYMGALEPLPPGASGWARLWKGLGFALLVYGVLMLVGVAAGGRDSLQPLRGLAPVATGTAPGRVQFRPVADVAGLERELAAARAAGRPVMLDFYADWCVSCKELERDTFSDPQVRQALAAHRYILLQADVTANSAADEALLQGRFGLPGPPAIIFFGPDGEERRGLRVVGYLPPERFLEHLREATR